MRLGEAGRWDVVVAGAGPAGATAARILARSGLAVLMVDRLAKATPKIGETLPEAALRLLDRLGLGGIAAARDEPDGPHWPVGGSLVAWNTDTLVPTDALRDPAGRGLRLDRRRFDADLRAASIAAGVVHRPADVAAVARSGQGWTIDLDDGGATHAAWIVDATGRRARIARLLGGSRRWAAPLVALYGTGVPGRNADLDRTVIEARPDGWIYAGRLGTGRWVFGYHTRPREAARLRSSKRPGEIFAGAPGLDGLLGPVRFDPGLVALDARGGALDPPCGAGWVACGDAALAFDPVAGQGLFNALRSGLAAAEMVAGAMAGGAEAGRYVDEMARVAEIYAMRRRALYRAERRWADRSFWQGQALIDPPPDVVRPQAATRLAGSIS
ncbi:NAD(P)/FAD-dependent oxidoreductase [Inquilinus limosus]|uniref:NAD(P)/FAD-dependent oxidoreductase n=1 Tax=Inquilinus limosus TaxID=171674 RepID=UPI00041A8DA7|nr:FAD-dependent monooxygenase [Inquilinus limosus]